jgi:hypothetical protein
MISAMGATGTAEWARPTLVPTGFPPSIAFGNAVGAPVAIPVPLVGFEQSYLGPPIDGNKYAGAKR